MKSLLIIIFATAVLASCKGKDNSLNTDKNIVVLTDTSGATGSFLADTGMAKMPVAATPAAVPPTANPAPVSRTRTSSSTSASSGSTAGGGGNASTGSSGSGSVPASQPAQKTGWSKSAKGAVIGGVGGAAAGAIIGKSGKGAVIGGVLGATGGYIIGRGKDKKDGRVQ